MSRNSPQVRMLGAALILALLLSLALCAVAVGGEVTATNPGTTHHVAAKFKMTQPEMFIIGAPKCATTSLYALLKTHPQVCKGQTKEPQFFNHFFDKGEKYYSKLLDEDCNTSFVDASPDYLHSREAPGNMLKAYGSDGIKTKKLIVVLRNPVEREFSWYNHLVKNCAPKLRHYMKNHGDPKKLVGGPDIWAACSKSKHCKQLCHDDNSTTRVMPANNLLKGLFSFREYAASSSLHRSHYAENIQKWLQVFDRSQIMVMNFDTVTGNITQSMGAISGHYALTPFRDGKAMPKVNTASKDGSLQTELLCSTVDELEAGKGGFAARNAALYELLDKGGGPAAEPPFPPFKRPECVEDA